MQSDQGRKFDGGKLRYDLVPVLAYEQIAKVLTAGAQKYADNNWIQVPEGRKRYMAASIRHQQQYRKGEIYDPETGVHHLICSAVNSMFIAEKDLQGWEDAPDTPVKDLVSEVHKGEMIVPKLESSPWYPDDSGEWVEVPTDLNIIPPSLDYNDSITVLLQGERNRQDYSFCDGDAGYWNWKLQGNSRIVAYKKV